MNVNNNSIYTKNVQGYEILMNYRVITAENDKSEDLAKWMGLLARYSPNNRLEKKMIRKLEAYFEYYWSHDRNYAIRDKDGQRFMSELPEDIKQRLQTEFLFKDFMYLFRNYFVFDEKKDGRKINAFVMQD